MIGRGDGQIGFTAKLALIIDQRPVLFREQQFPHPPLKRKGPVVGLLHVSAPCIGMQVVHDIAAPYEKNALIAQNRQTPTNVEVKRGRLGFIDAELNDGNVCERIDMAKD